MRDALIMTAALLVSILIAACVGVAVGRTDRSLLDFPEALSLTFTLFWATPVGIAAAAAAMATWFLCLFSEAFVWRSLGFVATVTLFAFHAGLVAGATK